MSSFKSVSQLDSNLALVSVPEARPPIRNVHECIEALRIHWPASPLKFPNEYLLEKLAVVIRARVENPRKV